MKIALINKNPVVSKLIELSIKDTEHTVVETDDINTINEDYDLFIIDDGCYNPDMAELISNKNTILLTNVKTFFDELKTTKILSKPFLPTQLFNLINSDTSSETISQKPISNKILNAGDIEQIKELLEKPKASNGNQVYEDNLSYVFKKNKESKEKRILFALLKMKPKKLKKLLADAEITISIRFPKES
ncbi:MAG: hypothetical protein PHE73_06240 [Sulfurovaceae bacterium]|nr:hypothetical protein [Sulfurovaceae bacterium]